jgi:response regulator RpfG family c-di-GMP phosphodiesterase
MALSSLAVRKRPSSPDLRGRTIITTPAQVLLAELFTQSLVLTEDWETLTEEVQERVHACVDRESLLSKLVEHRLITEYQAERIRNGKTHGLILGNHRVLDRLGSGGMGIVFRGEHLRLRRPVAIKVVPAFSDREDAGRALSRFYAEVRAVAQLAHPNVVRALDAGEVASPDSDSPVLHYYVMEYVEGDDLEEHVRQIGPLPAGRACELTYQVAGALSEAHDLHLIHRDIKPSNILVDLEGKAKLLDFGLVRHFRHRLTEPGTVLGTVDYISPEQARDSSTVDHRSDIYSLGGTLFYMLTGRPPFEPKGDFIKDLASRQESPPPSARVWSPSVPAELDRVLAKMMAVHKEERHASAQAVMTALIPFLQPELREQALRPLAVERGATTPDALPRLAIAAQKHRVLVVDDEPCIRQVCKTALEAEGIACDEAPDGWHALAALASPNYDLVLLDWNLPDLGGGEVCRRLREYAPSSRLKIVMISGMSRGDDLVQSLHSGADDCLSKPFSLTTLSARVRMLLRVRDEQQHSELLNQHLMAINTKLEQSLSCSHADLASTQSAMVQALARLAGFRDVESPAHLTRMQRYARRLAEEAMDLPAFDNQIDYAFIQELECAAPLHDIGKAGLPDNILLKDGRLEPTERFLMQTHSMLGSETLTEVMKAHGKGMTYLELAAQIARHHHERWDGAGYPDGLAGEAIPLAARIVTVGDVYDALRSRRAYKPALTHQAALQIMFDNSPGQFDPNLLQAFRRCAPDFERIFRDMPD